MLTLGLFTATRVQAASYLLGVCLFSISFLVFLNSAISFVITDRIGQKTRVGDAVGTLGFADELVALVACPVWGMLSDRVGVRMVAVCGYAIVGVSLMVFVQATNVYPQLLLGRLLFSLGGAATSTMVTAILPAMTFKRAAPLPRAINWSSTNVSSHTNSPSISSELTITPDRFRKPSTDGSIQSPDSEPSASRLAGIVGMVTGFGALVALGFFLPLPTRFQNGGASRSEAVADSFYVVGSVALVVAVAVFFGLRNLPGEEPKGWRKLIDSSRSAKKINGCEEQSNPLTSYPQLLLKSIELGFRDMNIALGYIGGFVARASSVAISLFIPLYVNAFFISSGRCPSDHDRTDPIEARLNCKRAYVVAAILAGVSQLIALICAPIFGYLSAKYTRYNLPLLIAAVAGIIGYSTFALIKDPDPRQNGAGVFAIVALLGISQIGAIVCSLGQLARGIETDDISQEMDFAQQNTIPNSSHRRSNSSDQSGDDTEVATEEDSPLLPSHLRGIMQNSSRAHLKGSIAGIYSLAGGAGILLLTKVGGLMFDRVDPGSPFFIMAGFNAILFFAALGCGIVSNWERKAQPPSANEEDLERDDG